MPLPGVTVGSIGRSHAKAGITRSAMSRSCATGIPVWMLSASQCTEPASAMLRATSSGSRRSISSAMRSSAAARSAGLIRGQGPSSKAVRAASTARRTSATEAWGTSAIVSSVAGFRTTSIASERPSVRRPSM